MPVPSWLPLLVNRMQGGSLMFLDVIERVSVEAVSSEWRDQVRDPTL